MEKGWIDEKIYEYVRRKMPIASVDVLPVYNGKLLLLRRVNAPGKGLWWIPGGRVRFGEKLEDAARRELLEETGLKAKKLEMKGVMDHIWLEVHFVTTFFLAEVNSMNVEMNDEHYDFTWVSSIEDDFHAYLKYMINESNLF